MSAVLDRQHLLTSMDTAIEMAEAELYADSSMFGEWLAQADDDREPCAYFTPISTVELYRLMTNDNASADQCREACRELKRRYRADHQEWVEHRANEHAYP